MKLHCRSFLIRLPLLLYLMMFVVVVVNALDVRGKSSALSCPVGWTSSSLWLAMDHDAMWCVKPQASLVTPFEVNEACKHIFDVDPPRDSSGNLYTKLIPQAVSIHSEEQNIWLQEFLNPFFVQVGELVLLSGAAGFGDITWHYSNTMNETAAPLYTHFAPSVNWQSRSGCIAMRQDGFWDLVDCSSPKRPFVCGVFLHTNPTDNNSTGNDTNNSAPTTQEPTEGVPEEPPRPTRPPVPYPPLDCMKGWSPYYDKCYRLFTIPRETGEEGMSQQEARQYCEAIHSHITLTAILNENEGLFVDRLVKEWAKDRVESLSEFQVFTGGIFTSYGSVGVWYEDSLWYDDKDFALTFPSSPTWPTPANRLYSNWDVGEPRMSFGCLAVVPNGTWHAVDCRLSLPFLCSYLNDGSVTLEDPTVMPGDGSDSSNDGESTTTTTTAPSPPLNLSCLTDWTYFAPTRRCHRLFTDRTIAAADLEQRCGDLLAGTAAPAAAVHAATITTVEESAFAGRLVAAAGLPRALVGVSYTNSGLAGLFLDGSTAWRPNLAASLWAPGQPTRESGCVTIGPTGAWAHIPCGVPVPAYACAYHAGDVQPLPEPEPEETPSPVPTTSTEAPGSGDLPLTTRITSLAGARHLVVAAGTVGIYAVAGNGGPTDGFLLMFAPDLSEVIAGTEWVTEGVQLSSCGSYKKQEYIFAVMQGVVTVSHPNETMRGRVCISKDGLQYVPAGNITFEVVDVRLRGFIPLSSVTEEEEEELEKKREIAKTSKDNTYESNRYDVESQEIGIPLGSSGMLQPVFYQNSYQRTAEIRYFRFSSSSDCVSSGYTLFGKNLSLVRNGKKQFVISYQVADVVPVNKIGLERLHDPSFDEEQPPTVFFVCVSVLRNTTEVSVSNITMDGHNISNTLLTSLFNVNHNVVNYEKDQEIEGITSQSNNGKPIWIYTVVPNMRVYITPPHVVIRGMWVLPPAIRGDNETSTLLLSEESKRTVVVPQFSSPIIVFDGEGLRDGMTLLLSQKLGECSRQQQVPHRDPSNPVIPDELDTMIAVSTLNVSTTTANINIGDTHDKFVAFVQLNLNHTGMWGTNVSEDIQTWQVCFAYTPLSRFRPLLGMTIVVKRASISSVTAHDGNDNSVSSDVYRQLKIGVGFSGFLRFWGFDVSMWSPSTLSTTEIAFAMPPPGNEGISNPMFQCSNSSLFYGDRTFNIVVPPSTATGIQRTSFTEETTQDVFQQEENNIQEAAAVIIPPGFLQEETMRRMRVCLSLPLPFQSNNRVFYPTSATLDVRPVEVHFIGPYAASFPNSASEDRITVVEVAENSNDLVLPISGYGLRDDMILFLSEERCYPRLGEGDGDNDSVWRYVNRISRMNFTIMRLYDVPPNFQQIGSLQGSTKAGDVFITLNTSHTSSIVADRVFGTSRNPLFMCLCVPSTHRAVYPLEFKFVVRPPRVTSIRIAHQLPVRKDKEKATIITGIEGKSELHDSPVLVYASFVDLVVEGFGLHDQETVFIPAVNCSNVTSFLWRSPVHTSGVPSMVSNPFGNSAYDSSSLLSRYVNPLTSMSSWFLSLSQAHTARIGAFDPGNGIIDRFQWCVRYRDVDAFETSSSGSNSRKSGVSNNYNQHDNNKRGYTYDQISTLEGDDHDWRRGFVPTGIPYHLVIPPADGFLFGNSTTKHITLKTRHPTLGNWEMIQLVGPLIDHTNALGNPLFMFLAEELVPCKRLKNYFINTNDSDRFIMAVNGSAVLLPKLLTNTGRFKLCASAIYPERRSSEEGTEMALQFFELKGLHIDLVEPVYAVFSLNGTDYITVEQGQEWALPLSGSSISNRSIVRFRPLDANCSTPMPDGLDDVIVRDVFEGLKPFADDVWPSELNESEVEKDKRHYIVLERDFLRGLSVQKYKLCFKPDRSTEWLTSGIVLDVREHVRQPTRYNYFADDGSDDVISVTALPPTKVALEWLTHEKDTVNIVGAVAREVAVALWCRSKTVITDITENNNNNNSLGVEPCGSWRRVMFVRPLDDDRNPCFVDYEAVQSDIVCGPYVLDNGILTIPRGVSRNVSFYPNTTQPWIMCLETAPERWREPIYPFVQLQFTKPFPVGFRYHPDDSSNSSATFFGQVNQEINADVNRINAEGNTTLFLHIEDASKVFYLNGYAIQRGFKIRFGLNCDNNIDSKDLNENQTIEDVVWRMQRLNNTLLYTVPLTIEDDHGVFLLPSTHFSRLEEITPMCLSTDNGTSYMKTNLSLTVLSSQLRHDVPKDESHISEVAFQHTLVVPRLSKGSVNLTDMLTEKSIGNANKTNSKITRFIVGTRVMFSSVCYENREKLPIIIVTSPNLITLTETHTSVANKARLHICISTGNNKDNVVTTLTFRPSGLYFRVLDIAVSSIALHKTIPNSVVEENGVRHIIVRRSTESMLLDVKIERSIIDKKPTKVTEVPNLSRSLEERYIDMLDTPGALVLFRLAKFRLGKPCVIPDPEEEEATVNLLTAVTATFANDTLRVVAQDGTSVENVVLPLHTAKKEIVEPWSPSSLCFSVDGGRHYLSVGISYVSVTWAPTLRVKVPLRDEDEDEDDDEEEDENYPKRERKGNDYPVLSTVVHLFEQESLYGKLVDIRYNDFSSFTKDTPLNRYMGSFTADALWSGFLEDAGFVVGGAVYLSASMVEKNKEKTELRFSVNYRHRDIATGLTMQLKPMALRCIGEVPITFQQLHPQSNGWLLPIANPCGRSIQAGTIVRLVDVNTLSCDNPEVVEHNFVFDTILMKPREWSGLKKTPMMALQLPPALRYVPDGRYKVCVKKYNPSHIGRGSIFIDTPLEMEVTSSFIVNEVGSIQHGVLAAFMGAESSFTLRGSVVPFINDIRIAFVPIILTRDNINTIATECRRDLQWRLENKNSNETSLPILWKKSKSFNVHLFPEDLTSLTKHTTYRICYSVDGGMSFREAGDAPPFLLLVNLYPTILGMLTTREKVYDHNTVTPSALRLERLFAHDNISSIPNSSYVSPAGVTLFEDRPPSYYYNASMCFVGNGIGKGSGREASAAVKALAVAILRTDIFGHVCDGNNLTSVIKATEEVNPSWGDYIINPLALPVFVVNARSGCLWEYTPDDNTSNDMENKDEYSSSVLRHDWLLHTAALRAEGGISMQVLIQRASTEEERSRRESTSYLVCTSIDGVHFYSANAPLQENNKGENNTLELFLSSLTTEIPREVATPLENISRLPLVLRLDQYISGSYYVRDLAVVVVLVVRPQLTVSNDSVRLEGTREALERFQRKVALLLEVDPAIVVVRLEDHGVVSAAINVKDEKWMEYPTYTLSLSLLTDMRAATEDLTRIEEQTEDITPLPELLLRYVKLLDDNNTQTSLFSTLLHPGVYEKGLVRVWAPYVNFTFGTGVDLHTALLKHKSELPKMPAEELAWRTRFAAIPHATLVADNIPDESSKTPSTEIPLWTLLLLIVLPVGLIVGIVLGCRQRVQFQQSREEPRMKQQHRAERQNGHR